MTHPVRAVQRDNLRFHVYIDVEGRYQWQLVAGDDDYELAHSGEGFVTQADCLYAVNMVARSGGSTVIPVHYAEGIVEVSPPV